MWRCALRDRKGRPPGRRRALVRVAVAVAGTMSILAAAAAGSEEPDPAPETGAVQNDDNAGVDWTNPFFFGEIVVVDREEQPPPGTIDLLDAGALRAAGAVTVGEALELLPGVSLSVGGRNEQKIWVRGYDQTNVLLLVDGVPISDPYYGDLDLGQLPIFDVARVSVTRGAASPLYGPNGPAGVINVTTVSGGGPTRVGGTLRLTGERTALLHAGAAGGDGRLGWYVGVGGVTSDGWPLSSGFEPTEFEDGGARVNSDLRQSTAMGRVGWDLTDRDSLHASVRWIDAEKGIPFHTTEPVGFVRFSRFPQWRQTTVSLGYEHAGDDVRIQGRLYGHGFANTLDVYADPDLDELRLTSTFDDRVYGGYAVGEWSLAGGHQLGAAAHLRQDRHRKSEATPGGAGEPNERYAAWTWSVSAEDRWRVGERTQLIASLALEGLDVEQAQSLREVGGAPVLVDDPTADEVLLSPQLELRRRLGRRWTGSAAVYNRGRFPTMRQLYGTDPPNPELGPQTTTGIDIGVEFSLPPALTVRGTAFSNRVTDMITRRGRDFPYVNQDEAEIHGIELRLDGSAGILDYRASWTGLDHRFTSSSEGFEEIPYVPDHQLELLGVVHVGARVDLRGTWLLTGDRASYDRDGKVDSGGYSILDLGIAGRIGGVELSLQIDNVVDADVELEPGYPMPGRRVWLGCRFLVEP